MSCYDATNKEYEYQGKIYSEEDLSEEIDNYGGDLFDLYWELKNQGHANETTLYYNTDDEDKVYESYEELLMGEFKELEVK